MKKNGFTLVELLAVVCILALITLMGTVGLSSLKEGINKSMWNSTIELIENAASRYGEDKKSIIVKNNESCKIDAKTITPCTIITVEDLIEKKYLTTKDTVTINSEQRKVIINSTIAKSNNETDNLNSGYYVNNEKVYIYIDNNIAYAKYMGPQ